MTAPCATGCGVPMDPVLYEQGWTAHPACEFGIRPLSRPAYWQAVRDAHYRKRHPRGQQPIKGTKMWLPAYLRPVPAPALPGDVEPPKPPRAAPAPPPPTSEQTAGARLPRAGSKGRHVYDLIHAAGRRGLCDAELRKAATIELPAHGALGAMIGDMHTKGLVVRAPLRREVPGGAHQDVWVATTHAPR